MQEQNPSNNTQPPASQPPLNNQMWNGSYNRESGQKTLAFIGAIIFIVTILSIISLLMINKKSPALAANSQTQTNTPK